MQNPPQNPILRLRLSLQSLKPDFNQGKKVLHNPQSVIKASIDPQSLEHQQFHLFRQTSSNLPLLKNSWNYVIAFLQRMDQKHRVFSFVEILAEAFVIDVL